MTEKQLAWAAGIALAPLALWLAYRALFWLWKAMPDGKLKRLLFQSYWGKDNGPWASAPWQRKKARDRSALVSRDGDGL